MLGGNCLPTRVLLANLKNRCHDLCEKVRQVPKVLQHPKIICRETHLYELAMALAVWGIDLIDPLPIVLPAFKYVVVVVDYFTKWAEAKPLTTISNKKV